MFTIYLSGRAPCCKSKDSSDVCVTSSQLFCAQAAHDVIGSPQGILPRVRMPRDQTPIAREDLDQINATHHISQITTYHAA